MCRGGGFLPGCFLPSGRRACFVGSLRGKEGAGCRAPRISARERVLLWAWKAGDGWFGLVGASRVGQRWLSSVSYRPLVFNLFKNADAGASELPSSRASPTCLNHSLTPAPALLKIWSRTVRRLLQFKELPVSSPPQPNRARADAPQTKAAAKNNVRLRHLRPSLRGGAAGHR